MAFCSADDGDLSSLGEEYTLMAYLIFRCTCDDAILSNCIATATAAAEPRHPPFLVLCVCACGCSSSEVIVRWMQRRRRCQCGIGIGLVGANQERSEAVVCRRRPEATEIDRRRWWLLLLVLGALNNSRKMNDL